MSDDPVPVPTQTEAISASFRHDDRHVRIRRILEHQRLDGIVAIGTSYGTWLTGYHRYLAGVSATLIGQRDGVELLVSADERSIAERESSASQVHSYGESGFGLDLNPEASLLDAISRSEVLRHGRRVGFAGVAQSLLERLGAVEWVPVGDALAGVMAVKDRDEAQKIAISYQLCMDAQAAVAQGVSAGTSELSLFSQAYVTAQLGAGTPIRFMSDVLSGPRSAGVCCPAVVAGSRQVVDGEPVIADVAVQVAGYWGDTCRTHVRGDNDDAGALIVQLASTLEEIVGELTPGVRANDIYAAMACRLRDEFPGSVPLPHHGGHGLGLDYCEPPHIVPCDATALEAGMIIAIEPGVYFPGRFGIRLENEYLVTTAGGVELSAALRSLPDSHEECRR